MHENIRCSVFPRKRGDFSFPRDWRPINSLSPQLPGVKDYVAVKGIPETKVAGKGAYSYGCLNEARFHGVAIKVECKERSNVFKQSIRFLGWPHISRGCSHCPVLSRDKFLEREAAPGKTSKNDHSRASWPFPWRINAVLIIFNTSTFINDAFNDVVVPSLHITEASISTLAVGVLLTDVGCLKMDVLCSLR